MAEIMILIFIHEIDPIMILIFIHEIDPSFMLATS